MEKLNKDKLILLVILLVACVVLGCFYYASQVKKQNFAEAQKLIPQDRQQEKQQPSSISSIAYITDIHADKKIKREKEGNVIYPSEYKKCLEEVLALKTDLVITTGDNIDKENSGYYQDLKSIASGKNFIWVKGNHDSDDFKILSDKNYYYVDYKNLRVIVLDTSEQFGSSTGYLDDAQISFLKDSLNLDKDIIIAMHHPPFFYNSRANIYTRDKISLYDNLFNALTPNVKYVLTGHWHYEIGAEIDGVQYLTEKAFTQDGICNYKIINI